MNKKGFTMIELLAVIAILAILVVFAVPNVIKMLDKAKRNSFVTEVKSLYKAAEQKYISEAMNGNDLSGSRVCSDGEDVLGISGNLEYCVEYDGDGKVINLEASNNKYNVALNDLNGINDIDAKIGNINSLPEGTLDPTLYSVFKNQFEKPDNNIAGRYGDNASDGAHKDTYGVNGNKTIYYFKADNDNEAASVLNKNNVIFAGHCWQMIRTTDTGGVKLLYNGEAVNNRCYNVKEPTNATHVGYVSETTHIINSSYKYADNYTYSGGTFTLVDNIITQTWSDSAKDNLLGKYTCKTTGNTCSKLYLVAKYVSSTQAKLIKIDSNSHYSQFGTLQFNDESNSPAYVGYKYGKVYPYKTKVESSISQFNSGILYSGGKYTLNGTSNSLATSNERYFCLDTTCSMVGYVFYKDETAVFYLELNGEANIDEVLTNMLDNNMYDSTMKIGLEAWYKKYLLNYNNFIEQKAIFCNRRDINEKNSGGFILGNSLSSFGALGFKDGYYNRDLGCDDVKDQFSIANTNATLNYPIGLLTFPEGYIVGEKNINTENNYWLSSARMFYIDNSSANFSIRLNFMYYSGYLGNCPVTGGNGVRPMIVIKPGTSYSDGTGTLTDPYIID